MMFMACSSSASTCAVAMAPIWSSLWVSDAKVRATSRASRRTSTRSSMAVSVCWTMTRARSMFRAYWLFRASIPSYSWIRPTPLASSSYALILRPVEAMFWMRVISPRLFMVLL